MPIFMSQRVLASSGPALSYELSQRFVLLMDVWELGFEIGEQLVYVFHGGPPYTVFHGRARPRTLSRAVPARYTLAGYPSRARSTHS